MILKADSSSSLIVAVASLALVRASVRGSGRNSSVEFCVLRVSDMAVGGMIVMVS